MGMYDAWRRVRREIARIATCGERSVFTNGSGAGRAMRVWCALRGGVALASAALLFAVIAFTHPLGARAATVTVNNTLDSSPFGNASHCAAGNAGTCSLRDAVEYANANDGTTITFGLPNPSTIPLASHFALNLTRTTGSGTTITGPGAAALAIDGGCTVSNGYCTSGIGGMPIFMVNSGVTASMSGLTLQHGLGLNDANSNTIGGGAIYNRGRLTVTDSTLSVNTGHYGGTIYNVTGANLTLTNSTISGSESVDRGGGIFNDGTLTATNCTVSGSTNLAGAGGGIWNTGTLAMTNCTISGNNSPSSGGGIFHIGDLITLTNCTISGNTAAGDGGGIDIVGGTLTVTNSTISNNTATATAGDGGGIWNQAGTLTVTNSTISGNNAGAGGGIYNGGTLTLTNSTISGNSVTDYGGGIYNITARTATLTNSTISGNTATSATGGISNVGGGTLMVTNMIVAGNSAPAGQFGIDLSGPSSITSGGHNLFGSITGAPITLAPSDLVNSTPLLGTLGSYGGPTKTIPLLPGSPAIDAGDDTTCNTTTGTAPVNKLDQRGITRPQRTHCDIGAFESQGFTLARTSGNSQSATTGTAFSAPLVVTVASTHSEPVNGGVVTFTGPNSGAGITPNPVTATIGATTTGQARVTPTANGTAGTNYSVTAGAAGTTPETVAFTLTNTTPPLSLTAIAPTSGSTAGGTSVTLTGISFAAGATVSFDGIAATNVVVVNSTSIKATTPAHAAGAVDVVVTSNGTATLTQGYQYMSPPPTLTAIAPTSGPTAGGTSVTLTGTSFAAGATVTFDGVAATNVVVVNSTTITATTPAHTAGAVDVVVTTTGTATLTQGYTYTAPTAPTLTTVDPTEGPVDGGTNVTLSGTGFVAGATVSFDGIAATNVVVVDSATITATTPAHTAGLVDVVVTTNGTTVTLPLGYLYMPPPPTLTAITPSYGSTAGGTSITLTGTGFAAGAIVGIGNIAATNVVVVNSTTITATTPAHAAGAVDVIVITNDGVATLTQGYTYGAVSTLPGSKPSPSPGGASNPLPAARPAGSSGQGGPAPNPLPASRP